MIRKVLPFFLYPIFEDGKGWAVLHVISTGIFWGVLINLTI